MNDITKHYDNGEITIIWQPSLCIHSAKCFVGLPSVFNPRKRPWVSMEGTETAQIIEQVQKCPSGALSCKESSGVAGNDENELKEVIIEPAVNGPLIVHGSITVKHEDGTIIQRENKTAFCRCGSSSNKPFCDGTHKKINFTSKNQN